MKTLRLESPWMPVWFRIVCGVCAALAGVYCYAERRFPPVLVNRQRVTVEPGGVAVRRWPLPVGFGVTAARAEISHAYARRVGEEWAMGVETNGGRQIDLHYPFADQAAAIAAAQDIVPILAPIRIRTVETKAMRRRG